MITDIYLQNFRSYKDDLFELDPGVNIIVGPNASGKTNLLEAILVVAIGKSFRGRDRELIAHNQPSARLKAHTNTNDERIVRIELINELTRKEFKINDQEYKRLNLEKSIPVVIFEPTHLSILKGVPENRRQFLDSLLEQTTPGYATTLRQYRRTLAQRNALLKKGYHQAKPQLFAWDVRLSELGSIIALARNNLVDAMNENISDLYSSVARSNNKIKLKYQNTVSIKTYATTLVHKLESSTELDCARGFTSYGPHREDLLVFIDGHPASTTASRGENRTLMLVFKVIEAMLIEKARDIRPLLLLDDVFSELDGVRRQALTNFLKSYQTFITTTDADVVIQHFTESTHVIPIS